MKVVKVSDLREARKELDNQMIETPYSFGERTVYVKPFIPMEEKAQLINNILYDLQLVNPDIGFSGEDEIVANILFKTETVKVYSNINLPKDLLESYNLVQSLDLYDMVIDTLPKGEREDLLFLYNKKLETIKAENKGNDDILGLLGDLIQKGSMMLDELDFSLPSEKELARTRKQLDALDKDKLKELREFVEADEHKKQ